MPLTWPDDPAWQQLAAPLRTVLATALERLDLQPETLPRLVVGSGGPGAIGLDPALLGPDVRHPDDQAWAETHPELAALALDRWRRAAGLILEGVALMAIEEEVGAAVPDAWWTLGPAAEAVDRAAPELGWLWPDAADLLSTPEVGLVAAPRRAAWLVRWFRETGRPWTLGERPDLDAESWAAFGAWLEDLHHGPAADAPVPLSRGPAMAPDDLVLAPLSHHRLHLEGAACGTLATWPGGRRGLGAGQIEELFVGTVDGGALGVALHDAMPLGEWHMTGGTVGERAGAARGIEMTLFADGRIDLIFADAFAGPPTKYMLGLGKQLGVSGSGTGRFRVVAVDDAGHGTVIFDALDPQGLTAHPRFSGKFALPAEMVLGPITKALDAMVGVPWVFREDDEGLRLEAQLFGATTVLRLERPPDDD